METVDSDSLGFFREYCELCYKYHRILYQDAILKTDYYAMTTHLSRIYVPEKLKGPLSTLPAEAELICSLLKEYGKKE